MSFAQISTLVICYFVGNYGNQLDLSVPPSSSSTSPTNAIFDGSFYYFLPWNDIKPCCNVDSHWEDIAFRLEPLNILTRMCEQLVSTFRKKIDYCSKDDCSVLKVVSLLFIADNEYFIASDTVWHTKSVSCYLTSIRHMYTLLTYCYPNLEQRTFLVVVNQFHFVPILYTNLL